MEEEGFEDFAEGPIDSKLRCSFCGKSQDEVRILAGPCVFICNECIALMNEILGEENLGRAEVPPLKLDFKIANALQKTLSEVEAEVRARSEGKTGDEELLGSLTRELREQLIAFRRSSLRLSNSSDSL